MFNWEIRPRKTKKSREKKKTGGKGKERAILENRGPDLRSNLQGRAFREFPALPGTDSPPKAPCRYSADWRDRARASFAMSRHGRGRCPKSWRERPSRPRR